MECKFEGLGMAGCVGWDRGQNSTFSEYGLVDYQIKENDLYSNMVANILPIYHILCPYTHPGPLGWGQRSKHFFSESSHVVYQINWNRG